MPRFPSRLACLKLPVPTCLCSLSSLPLSHLSFLTPLFPLPFSQVRNQVLARWRSNVSRFMAEKEALAGLPKADKAYGLAAYHFLHGGWTLSVVQWLIVHKCVSYVCTRLCTDMYHL